MTRNSRERASAPYIDLRNEEEIEINDDNLYYHLLKGNITCEELYGVAKSDDQGDEAVEPSHSPNVKTKKDVPISLDLADGTRMKFPSRRALAEWTAIQARVRKNSTSKDQPTMPTPLDLSAVVKNHGIGALCRHIVKSASSFGIDEHQLVKLATEDAARTHPHDTPEIAFAKLYEESEELRDAIDIAKGVSFQNDIAVEFEKDARDAMDELNKIGKAKWPSLTPAQRFARAFETNPELAKRAHRRPGPSTSFPHPTAKADKASLVAPLYDPTPRVTDELDVEDPREAVRQLQELGAQKWPSASKLEQLERALTDPEHAALITAAFRPTGSSPPRQ